MAKEAGNQALPQGTNGGLATLSGGKRGDVWERVKLRKGEGLGSAAWGACG